MTAEDYKKNLDSLRTSLAKQISEAQQTERDPKVLTEKLLKITHDFKEKVAVLNGELAESSVVPITKSVSLTDQADAKKQAAELMALIEKENRSSPKEGELEFRNGTTGVSAMDWSPDGKKIVVLSSFFRYATVLDSMTGKILSSRNDLFAGPESIQFFTDQEIVIAPEQSSDAAQVWNFETQKIRSLEGPGGKKAVFALNMLYDFSVDRKSGLLAGVFQKSYKQGTIFQMAIYSLKKARLEKAIDHNCTDVALAPGGQQIACIGQDGIDILNSTSGKLERTIEENTFRVTSIAWSHDGKFVAFGMRPRSSHPPADQKKNLQIWDTKEGKQIDSASVPKEVKSLDFSADGKYLGASDVSGAVHLISTQNYAHVKKTYSVSESQTVVVRFSPDGRWLARLMTKSGKVVLDKVP